MYASWSGTGIRRPRVSIAPSCGSGPGLVSADETGPPGWDLVTIRFADVGSFADYAARFGPDAVVLDPPDLREAVIARLKGVLA
jgi:proteasome accessory factor B